MMKSLWLVKGIALWTVLLLSCETALCGECAISIITDKPEALYSIGERISFNITLTDDGKPISGQAIDYSITRNGVRGDISGKIVSAEGPVAIETTMENPGFVLLRASFANADGDKVSGLGGAGVEPLKIKPGLELKDDFDAFWDVKKKELAELPLEVKMEPADVPKSIKGDIECFDVKINCVGGASVSGYFARPRNAEKASLPAIATYQGAGVHSANKAEACSWASKGMLSIAINAHGIENGKPEEFYKALGLGALAGYYKRFGAGDREKCYFLGMLQRVCRSLQFLKSQAEWDGKCLVVAGSSQGGGQAIAGAGLDPQVTFCAAFVPALCDHYGYLANRTNGWPNVIAINKSGSPVEENVVDVAKFFDGVNFASRIKGDAIFTVGFIDVVCCPASVYAAYNCIVGKKRIVNNPLLGHSNSKEAVATINSAIADHVKSMSSATHSH